MKLLYWFSIRGLLVPEVGDCGVFENKPVFFVWSQCESFRSVNNKCCEIMLIQ